VVFLGHPQQVGARLKLEARIVIVFELGTEGEAQGVGDLDLVLEEGTVEMIGTARGVQCEEHAGPGVVRHLAVTQTPLEVMGRPVQSMLDVHVENIVLVGEDIVVPAAVVEVGLDCNFGAIGADMLPASEQIGARYRPVSGVIQKDRR
jgi:hypothetical protein